MLFIWIILPYAAITQEQFCKYGLGLGDALQSFSQAAPIILEPPVKEGTSFKRDLLWPN